MAPHRSLARHQRTYRRLLLAYPRAFRQVYGADMVQVFGDRLREGREDRGRRATVVVWLRTLLDLFRSAPIQRMESSMSREAGFSILFLLLLATIVTLFALGSRIPAVVSLGVLVVTAVAFLATGSLKKGRSATRYLHRGSVRASGGSSSPRGSDRSRSSPASASSSTTRRSTTPAGWRSWVSRGCSSSPASGSAPDRRAGAIG